MKTYFTTVDIKCKPLVKLFLENNFGNPVTIPDEHVLNKLTSSQLVKKNSRYNDTGEYTETIKFNLDHNKFRYDGFFITETNIRKFNASVNNYIKVICRSNLDALLISDAKQKNWKMKFLQLLEHISSENINNQIKADIKQFKKELDQHELNIKQCIEIVVTQFLKLDLDVLPYETVKKDYYRYRLKQNKSIN